MTEDFHDVSAEEAAPRNERCRREWRGVSSRRRLIVTLRASRSITHYAAIVEK
jgi:hypothetical protein